MKWVFVVVLATGLGLINDIAKINKLKSEAQRSFQAGDYQKALESYSILVDSFQVVEEEILINYANAAYLLTRPSNSPTRGVDPSSGASSQTLSGDESQLLKSIAQARYTSLAQNASDNIRSMAFNQLGAMAFHSAQSPKPGKEVLKQAQGLFKSALKANQGNEDARFNYELVTKMLKEEDQQQEDQKDQEQPDQNQEEQENQQENQQDQQQKQDQEQKQSGEDEQQQDQSGEDEKSEKQDGEPKDSDQQEEPDEEQGEQKPQEKPLNASPEKMEELKISEEKARMILEAMKNSEVQYIQQNQRKTTKRPESGKPDW